MRLNSIRILLFSYFGIALFGALLLSLDVAHRGEMKFLDAFFTAVSAFTCTGLIVKDTALDFTPLGQGIILGLIQLGGFGYMTMLGLLYVLFRKNLGKTEKTLIKETLNCYSYDGLVVFIKKIFIYVVILESVGAVLLGLIFCVKFGLDGVWYSVFHAISAFNNAGFSTFSTNLIDFRANILVNLVICLLIIIGGLGYISIAELHFFAYQKFQNSKKSDSLQAGSKEIRPSLHLKIVLSGTLILIVLGMVMLLVLEWDNIKTFKNFSLYEKVLSAFFTSVNYRTAGFNTFDLGGLRDSSLFFSVLLMAIGGAPGGTAAGIKITTVAVLLAFCRGVLTDSKPRLFGRAIDGDNVQKAIAIFLIACIYILGSSLILSIAEPDARFLGIMFEVGSAFATVGDSVGNGGTLSLSAHFNDFGKCVIIFMMISGKIGILAFSLALFGSPRTPRVEYIKERVVL
ncbi:hypothetical protein BKH46_06830 [Helicobacter sp. 12S02634-8]|uniref:TrkH family potassium uptake protein n=1 Tax=Helicobacter sp. 12S02634-8 TaxID=1476199 RepID=UPI000BA55B4A|nr:potassium transporter TrkG [Helicobacter sp. 12S02634-8]PAF46677.1 hypothetical protein BKH46_06830 [Helicobacter sp. 12S02634-8]